MNKSKKVVQSTAVVAIVLMLGKIFGFVNRMLRANYFGAGMEAEAITAAQTATTQILVFISAAITTTLIPMLAKVYNEKGNKGKNTYLNNLINIGTILGGILAILGIIFAPVIVKVLSKGFDLETFELTVELTRINMPAITFAAAIGVLTGFLQNEGKFGIAGASVIPPYIVYILYMVLFSSIFGIKGYAVAGIVGTIIQVIFLLPASFKSSFRPKLILDLSDKYVKQTLYLSIPVILSTILLNINDAINLRMGSSLTQGSVVWLSNGNSLNNLLIGVFVAAIAQVIYPSLSTAFASKNYKDGRNSMIKAVRFISLVILPSTIGLFILAKPVVEIAFMRGEYTQFDADMTALALRAYSLELFALSLSNVLNKVYYSLQDTKTPLIMSFVGMVLNVAFKLLLVGSMQHVGLALAFSLATNIQVLLLFIVLRMKLKYIGGTEYVKMIAKLGFASILMGGLTYASFFGVASIVPALTVGTFRKLILLFFSVFVSAIFYGFICYRIRVPEVTMAVDYVKGKLNAK